MGWTYSLLQPIQPSCFVVSIVDQPLSLTRRGSFGITYVGCLLVLLSHESDTKYRVMRTTLRNAVPWVDAEADATILFVCLPPQLGGNGLCFHSPR